MHVEKNSARFNKGLIVPFIDLSPARFGKVSVK